VHRNADVPNQSALAGQVIRDGDENVLMPIIEITYGPPARAAPPRRRHLLAAAIFFAVIAVYGSLVPLEYEPIAWDAAVNRFRHIQYLELDIKSRADWVANILLFIPLGFLFLGGIAADRTRAVAVAAALPVVIVLGTCSLALEFTQLWFPRRTVSQNDILAEMIGAVVGAGLWILVGQAVVDWVRSFTTDRRVQSRVHKLLQLYTFGLVIYSILPLDLTISVGELYDKYKMGRMVLVPLTYDYGSYPLMIYNVLVDLLVFVPVGMLAARGLFQELPSLRSVAEAIAIGALLVVGIELAQLIVYSRISDVTDLVTCTTGVSVGAWLAHRLQPTAPHMVLPSRHQIAGARLILWTVLVLVYTAILIAVFWFPFDFHVDSDFAEPRLAQFFDVPFRRMYRGTEFKAIRQFLRKTLMFGVLGALWVPLAAHLNVTHVMRRLFLAGALLYCVILATGIEMGQVFLPSHSPDFTDVLLCTLGAGSGMLLANFVRRQR
jgi:glycopeptide antibiotics resistance protein